MEDRRYPLHWPEDQARTAPHLRSYGSRYKVSQEQSQRELWRELELMGARNVVVSTNIQLRRDGLPYSGRRAPDDPGVAIYWTTKDGVDVCIACDGFQRLRDNMRACGLSIAALRSIERAGATQVLERAYRGFTRLPPSKRPWREVLGAKPGDNFPAVKQRYRELARRHHPDHGGNSTTMAVINDAWADAQKELV